MTSQERVKAIIARTSFDRIPYSFDITNAIYRKMMEHYGNPPVFLHTFIGDDLCYVGADLPPAEEARIWASGRDEFGVAHGFSDTASAMGDCGKILDVPLKEPVIGDYKFPDGNAPGRFSKLDVQSVIDTKRFVVYGILGLLDTAWHLRGFENFLGDLVGEPEFAAEVLEKCADYIIGVVNQAPSCIDGIRFTEDWGFQSRLMMNPNTWRKMLKPQLKRMYDAARKRGFTVMIHTCGCVTDIFPDIIELGVEVVNAIQPEAMDVNFLKREYGQDVTLYGGIGCQSTLVYGTPEQTIAEAKDRLRILGEGGGYILGPAGAIPVDAKIENVIALTDFCMNGYK